jgi:hypothetical protein
VGGCTLKLVTLLLLMLMKAPIRGADGHTTAVHNKMAKAWVSKVCPCKVHFGVRCGVLASAGLCCAAWEVNEGITCLLSQDSMETVHRFA